MSNKKETDKTTSQETARESSEKVADKAEETPVQPESSDEALSEPEVSTETTEAASTGEGVSSEVETSTEAEASTEEASEEEVEDAVEVGIEETEAIIEELKLAQEEATKNLENWQRTAAELANYKRRQEEQFKLQRDRIKTEVLEGVISALDDLDLAFQNLPEEIDGQLIGWVEGFRLVQRKLNKILDEQNVMPIDTAGQFDPNFHEAVSYEPSNEHEPDQVIAELRKGYQIGNRVIRPALVRVAS